MTSRAVSPRVGKVSEEVEGGDSDVNECSSESNEEEQHALQGFDVDSETRQVRRQRRAHRPPTVKSTSPTTENGSENCVFTA